MQYTAVFIVWTEDCITWMNDILELSRSTSWQVHATSEFSSYIKPTALLLGSSSGSLVHYK